MRLLKNVTVPMSLLAHVINTKLTMFPNYMVKRGTRADTLPKWEKQDKDYILVVFFKEKGQKPKWLGTIYLMDGPAETWTFDQNDHICLDLPEMRYIMHVTMHVENILKDNPCNSTK